MNIPVPEWSITHDRQLIAGLIFAAVLFAISGGHLLFLPLFFVLPLGGLFGHRRRSRRW